jgi:hypothetical protein
MRANKKDSIGNSGALNRRNARTADITKPGTASNRLNSPTQNNNNNNNENFGLNDDVISLHSKISLLEKDLERRQESYILRERSYKIRIDELEEEITSQRDAKTGWMKADEKINKLKKMQGQILENVELVQDRTARILQVSNI